MLASPSCPGLVPGRPYLQIDYARASWACDRLSSSALRCWLRLLTYFRNDRPIPLPTHRSLARIAGVSKASARKALSELLPLVAFSQPLLDEDEEQETGPDTGGQKMTDVAPAEPICGQNLTIPWSNSDQKRSENDHTRSKNDHPTICIKEVEKKGITPPPTSSSAAQAGPTASRPEQEGGPFLENLLWSEASSQASSQANSQQPLTGGNSPVAAGQGPGAGGAAGCDPAPGPVVVPDPNFDPHRIPVDRRLFEVGAELMHFWCGKPGPRSAMAFAVLQSELIQIAESPLGGIEAVREQLVTGVQKGWAMVKFRTWHSWRQSQPQPILVSDEELDEGSLWPGLPSFIRRYRATYGKSCSDTELTCAYISHREKLLKQANPKGLDLGPNAWMHSAHVPNPTLPSATELASYAADWQQAQNGWRAALVNQGGGREQWRSLPRTLLAPLGRSANCCPTPSGPVSMPSCCSGPRCRSRCSRN